MDWAQRLAVPVEQGADIWPQERRDNDEGCCDGRRDLGDGGAIDGGPSAAIEADGDGQRTEGLPGRLQIRSRQGRYPSRSRPAVALRCARGSLPDRGRSSSRPGDNEAGLLVLPGLLLVRGADCRSEQWRQKGDSVVMPEETVRKLALKGLPVSLQRSGICNACQLLALDVRFRAMQIFSDVKTSERLMKGIVRYCCSCSTGAVAS